MSNQKYDGIINLPHHTSTRHARMSIQNRAAQFSPFAALTGYDDAVKETARLTDQRVELDECQKAALDERLQILNEHLAEHPEISITYFQPDDRKDGGAYTTITGTVRKIDPYERAVWMTDRTRIPIEEIVDVSGELFQLMENSVL